jgi:hypothetical protein
MSNTKPRARLSEDQVLAIFQARDSASATRVAVIYGVNEKTVRDIWTGRTWARETRHLDTARPFQLKVTGRPKGCRDRKPRKSRLIGRLEQSALTGSIAQAAHTGSPYTQMHSALEFEYNTLRMPLNQHPKSADSAACYKDPVSGHRSRATACWTSSSVPHASVDEQLYKWNEFYRARTSGSTDPFCFDWKPHQ